MGHLNGILAWEGGNLNNNVFSKKSNARGVAQGVARGDVEASI